MFTFVFKLLLLLHSRSYFSHSKVRLRFHDEASKIRSFAKEEGFCKKLKKHPSISYRRAKLWEFFRIKKVFFVKIGKAVFTFQPTRQP